MAADPAWIDSRGADEDEARWREDMEARLLVARAQRGERDAARELYECYFDPVYAYLRASLGHGADAEDVTQQVFVNALGALGRYDVEGAPPFRRWLFVIARNLLVDFLRRGERVRVVAPDELAERIERERSAPDPSEGLLGWALLTALRRLPERERQVLLLRFVADLKPAEVAEVLDITKGAVHQAQHRGGVTLRERLAGRSSSGRVLRVSMGRRDPGLPVLRARRMALLAA